MQSVLYVVVIVSTALLFGNEFSIGFFIHPSLGRSDHRGFLPAIQVFARFFGTIMPIWMPLTLVLHLLLLCLTWHWPESQTLFLLAATVLWTIIIVFSVLGPVPINNEVISWNPGRLPDDWEQKRRRWDALNAARVLLIGAAFVALILAYRALPI